MESELSVVQTANSYCASGSNDYKVISTVSHPQSGPLGRALFFIYIVKSGCLATG